MHHPVDAQGTHQRPRLGLHAVGAVDGVHHRACKALKEAFMKKYKAILLSVILLLTSCGLKEGSTTSKSLAIRSLEDVPPFEELAKYPLDRVKDVRNEIENIPIETYDDYYTELIKDFLDESGKTRFELLGVKILRDDLSLIQGENLKPRLNLIFQIDVKLNGTRELDDVEIAKSVSTEIMDFLSADTFFALKAAHIYVSTYDLNNYLINTSQLVKNAVHELRALELPEPEFSAQTAAFDFNKKMPEFVLQKFGAIQETKELYVEYFVNVSKSANESIADRLEDIHAEVVEYLLRDDSVVQYIDQFNLKILTISFYDGLEGTYQTFNTKL